MLHTEMTRLESIEHTETIRYMFISHIVITFLFLLLLIYHITSAKTIEERAVSIFALIIVILLSKETIYELWDLYGNQD